MELLLSYSEKFFLHDLILLELIWIDFVWKCPLFWINRNVVREVDAAVECNITNILELNASTVCSPKSTKDRSQEGSISLFIALQTELSHASALLYLCENMSMIERCGKQPMPVH